MWRPDDWEKPDGSWWHKPEIAFEAGADAILEALKENFGTEIKATAEWSLVMEAKEHHGETIDIQTPDNLVRQCGKKGWLIFIPEEDE